MGLALAREAVGLTRELLTTAPSREEEQRYRALYWEALQELAATQRVYARRLYSVVTRPRGPAPLQPQYFLKPSVEGQGWNRFVHLWEQWDAALASGQPLEAILAGVSEDDLILLLAGAGDDRGREKHLLAVELNDRVERHRRALAELTQEVERTVGFLVPAVADAPVAGSAEAVAAPSAPRDARPGEGAPRDPRA